nr:hypothetical protein TQ38_22610 [Novosphingobium sp. P6W]
MERNSQTRLVAMVVAQAYAPRRLQVARLERGGYDVRSFRTAWEALTMFGEEMPDAAFIEPTEASSCLDLLIEDLKRYGVTMSWIAQRREVRSPNQQLSEWVSPDRRGERRQALR